MISTLSTQTPRSSTGRSFSDGARATPVVHIIDDDEAIRDSLSFMLGVSGFDVRTYASAAAFLRVLPLPANDCVITDVRMPGLTGLEMLAALKAMGANLPVIVMTGHGDIDMAIRAMRVGAAEFIEKPFDEAAIIHAVEAVLDRG